MIVLLQFNPNIRAKTPYKCSIKEYADEYGIGKNKLYMFLREQGVLDVNNLPNSAYVDWFRIRQYNTDSYYVGEVQIPDLTELGYDEVTDLINNNGGTSYINNIRTR